MLSADTGSTDGNQEKLVIENLSISKFLPDPRRPVVYAINKNGSGVGSVLVIGSVTREIQESITVGSDPSDLDITADGSQLMVINSESPSISVINLATKTVTETIPLGSDVFTYRDRSDGNPGAHIKCGKSGIVYIVDEQWGPRLRVFNTVNRTLLQTLSSQSGTSPDFDNNLGYGDIGLNPTRTALYGWRQYGDGAGVTGTHLVSFRIGSDGLLTGYARSRDYGLVNFDREPYDTPVLMSGDGSRLVIKDR